MGAVMTQWTSSLLRRLKGYVVMWQLRYLLFRARDAIPITEKSVEHETANTDTGRPLTSRSKGKLLVM